MIILRNLESYKQYFADMAAKHKSIAFYVYDGTEVYQSDIRNEIKYPVLHLEPYDASLINKQSDNYLGMKRGALVIAEKPEEHNNFQQVDTIEAKCEQIVIDIISRIKRDREEGLLVTEIQAFKWSTIDPMFVDFTAGVRLEFEFMNPINVMFDETKWEL